MHDEEASELGGLPDLTGVDLADLRGIALDDTVLGGALARLEREISTNTGAVAGWQSVIGRGDRPGDEADASTEDEEAGEP